MATPRRFGTPLEIMTDCGSQFMNATLEGYATLTGVRHHSTIPYSKEENGIVERANKEVNRHIRNISSDHECVKNWPQMLCIWKVMVHHPELSHDKGILRGYNTFEALLFQPNFRDTSQYRLSRHRRKRGTKYLGKRFQRHGQQAMASSMIRWRYTQYHLVKSRDT